MQKINNPARLCKLIFLILVSSLCLLCCFKSLYSAEKEGNSTGEIKNNVFNRYEKEIGRVDEKGAIYSKYGRALGSVDENGIIYNVSDIEIGRVQSDGNIFNQSETRLGRVNEKGEIFNVSDIKIGFVKDLSDIKLIGGAARLIFF